MTGEEFLHTYKPRREHIPEAAWNRIRPLAIQVVLASTPATAHTANTRIRATARFLYWAEQVGHPLDPNVLFTEDLVEEFCETALSHKAKSTYRSAIRAVARANNRKAIWTPTPEPMRNSSLRDPYTGQEVEGYLRVAREQSTPRRIRTFELILTLGLGFGLTTSEMLRMTKHAIKEQDRLVLADTGKRIVPARRQFACSAQRLAEQTEDTALFGDHLRPRRALESIVGQLQIPDYLPPLRARRLRTTWMVEVLSDGNLTLPEFQRVAGVKSGRVLDDIVSHLPVREDYLKRAAG